MGGNLADVRNAVTGNTTACFEPALDYIVAKIPRWDISKFNNASPVLGSGMKSVGEVMAVGRCFEEAFQKAIRMVDPSHRGFQSEGPIEDLVDALTVPTEIRPYAIAEAFNQGYTVDQIHELTDIDTWFLTKCYYIHEMGQELSEHTLASLDAELMKDVKKSGFSDKQIAERIGSTELEVRAKRKAMGVTPVMKQIDTLAAEFPARTNYLYTTYGGTEDDVEFDLKDSAMVLGSGVYRIGSSVEFDYSAVQAVRTLRDLGKSTIMVNYNPETVSTDFDESDRLYFEELTLERVMDIHDKELPDGTIVSVGGQIPNNLALQLHECGANILGTHPHMIDSAEDRDKFSTLMDEIGVDQPAWQELSTYEEAAKFAEDVGYPVLVRPSYVLSGAAMNVVRTPTDLRRYLTEASAVSNEHPVVISKFITDSLEIELDAVAQNGKIVAHAIAEHIEQAGVHSGDATLVLPTQSLDPAIADQIYEIGQKVAGALQISGPFNAQFIVSKDGSIKIIETNLRASRSLPFCSKVLGVNFIEKAAHIFAGKEVEPVKPNLEAIDYVGVKAPQFSFPRLLGADPVLGVEMASTGEVACFGKDTDEAFVKSMLAATFRLPKKTILIMGGDNKDDFVEECRSLAAMGYNLLATPGTALHLSKHGVAVERVPMPRSDDYLADPHTPDVLHAMRNEKIDLFINFVKMTSLGKEPNTAEQRDTYKVRRAAVDHNVPIITNLQVAKQLVKSLGNVQFMKAQSYQELRAAAKAKEEELRS